MPELIASAGLRWVTQAVAAALPNDPNPSRHARALIAAAQDAHMPIEELVAWVRSPEFPQIAAIATSAIEEARQQSQAQLFDTAPLPD